MSYPHLFLLLCRRDDCDYYYNDDVMTMMMFSYVPIHPPIHVLCMFVSLLFRLIVFCGAIQSLIFGVLAFFQVGDLLQLLLLLLFQPPPLLLLLLLLLLPQ